MDRREFLAAAAAAAGASLAFAPAGLARVRGGTPLALVTADLESAVGAVDLSTGRIVRRLATLPGPRSIESVAGRAAVVAHTGEGALTLLDGVSLEVRRVLRGLGEPRYTAASPDGRHAYVTDSARGELVVLDLRRARVVRRVDLGGPARHVSIDRTGRTLWVALGSKAELVAVVDASEPERPRVVRRIDPPFLAHDVGFTPGGARVWVTSGDRGVVAVYEASTERVLFTVSAGSPPQHVTFVGGAAQVTSGKDGTLRVHALDGRVLRTVRVPVGSYNVQEGWGVVLTPSLDRGTLCVLDARGRLRERVQVARSSHDACFVMSR
jgi:DNA-binding beta-propeller fold protein YncE